jgi:hypothetical protein
MWEIDVVDAAIGLFQIQSKLERHGLKVRLQ